MIYSQIPVIDLFCGVGGLSHGLILEGFNVLAGIDFDAKCRYAYETNNKAKFVEADLRTVTSSDVDELYGKTSSRILVGCAPCQAFSTYSNTHKENQKWQLLYSFSRIVRDIQPEILSMENVGTLLTYRKGKVFQDFLKVLDDCGYNYTYEVVNAQDYGVPQRRKRIILLASKYGDIELLPPTHADNPVTVKKAIGGLPPIEAGETHPEDPLHRSRGLSEINLKRVKSTPEGGSWKDWPPELILECHKKKSGQTFGSVYGRMRWNEVAPTLTTHCLGLGNGRFGHPEQNRAISLREASILQSFPKDYKFIEPKLPLSVTQVQRQIGNAVPVNLARIVGKSIKAHLKLYHG